MPTPIFLTGWEHGVATLVSSGGGLANFVSNATTITVSTTQAHSGTYALKISPNGTDDAYYRITITGSPNTIVGRFYFYVDTEPAATSMIFDTTWVTATVGSNTNPGIYIDPSANTVQIRSGSGTVVATSSNTYTVGQWHYVDFSFNLSANPWVLKAKLDGGTEFSGGPALSADTAVNLRFGKDTAPAMTVYMDDAFISATGGDYPIGAGGTEALVPTADGTHNAGTNVMEDNTGADINGTTVTAFSKISSIPPSATTYIRQAANGTGNYVEVTFGNITATHSAILGAAGFLTYTSETTTSNRGACMISKDAFSSFTEIWGNNTTTQDYSDGSTSAPFYKRAILANVTDDTTVNALSARMGYSGDANPDPYWIDLLVEVAYSISSGTMTPQSVSGGITPSGAVTKQGNKTLSGGATPSGALLKLTSKLFSGGITPSGTIAKQAQKAFTGGITPSGVLATARMFAAVLSGAITPSGSLLKQAEKTLGSTLTSSGTLSKTSNKTLAGSITPSGVISKLTAKLFEGTLGLAGTLDKARSTFLSLGGSLTPSGTAIKTASKTFTGGVTPAGAISKQTNKAVSGNISSLVGTLQSTKTALMSLGGSLSSVGSLTKQADKLLGSIITPSGDVNKQTSKNLGSTITPSGSLFKIASKILGSLITPSGAISKQTGKASAGEIVPEGSTTKQPNKTLSGDITPSGSLLKNIQKFLFGVLTSAGDLAADFISGAGDLFFQSVGGTLTSDGALQKLTSKLTSGNLTAGGVLNKLSSFSLSGTLTSTGSTVKTTFKSFAGTLSSSGVVIAVSAFLISLGGTLTSAGTLLKQAQKNLQGSITGQGSLSKFISKFVSGVLTPIGQIGRGFFITLSGMLNISGLLSRLLNPPIAAISTVYLKGRLLLTARMEGIYSQVQQMVATSTPLATLRGVYQNIVRLIGKYKQ